MANLEKVVYLTEAQKETLFTDGTLTANGNTINYNDNDLYITPEENQNIYENKAAVNGGADVSLVTTGEKYTWNNKQAKITASGILKGDGIGGVSVATAGTDYATPAQVDAKATKPTKNSISLSATWSGSGPYTQTVTVSGYTITANSKVDLQPDASVIEQLITDGVQGLFVTNNTSTLTATAIGAAPSVGLNVQCTITEVST